MAEQRLPIVDSDDGQWGDVLNQFIENDKLYFTQTTGLVRKTFATYDDISGATGDIYYRDSASNFVRLPVGSNSQTLNVVDGTPGWTTMFSGFNTITVSTTAPSSPNIGDLWVDIN